MKEYKRRLLGTRHMFQKSDHRWKWLLSAILVVFVLFRLPALQQIYHQDEYKWAQIVKPSYGLAGASVHPPFTENVFRVWGMVAGFDHLRVFVLLFSIANLFLAMALANRWYGKRAAAWCGILLATSAASVLASVQIDIDGAFLPFWSLLAFHAATDVWQKSNRRGWMLLVVACIGGFFSKISFGLVPVTLAVEEAVRRGLKIPRKVLLVATAVCVVLGALWLSPLLDGVGPVRYAKSFGVLNFLHRDYFEILLLTMKVTVLFGPVALMACVGLLTHLKRYRVLALFVLTQFLFYIVIFDFSHRTLERYLLVFVMPIALIAGDVLAQATLQWRPSRRGLALAGIMSALLASIVLIPKDVIPLIPKAEFVRRGAHLDFSFLIPISGGSGPIGFFVPADVTLFAFVGMLALCLIAWRKPRLTTTLLPSMLCLLFIYPLLTTIEFNFGAFYGNASSVAKRAIQFVNASPEIASVITYNDIGGWELGESKKYFKRFYLNPEYAPTNEKKFASYDGHYLVVAMPPLSADMPSSKYFTKCKNLYHDTDKNVTADVYDCRGVPYGAQ